MGRKSIGRWKLFDKGAHRVDVYNLTFGALNTQQVNSQDIIVKIQVNGIVKLNVHIISNISPTSFLHSSPSKHTN